jgi:hypothetical protein
LYIFFSLFLFELNTDSTYRGDIDILSSIVKIIAHVDAYYLSHNPHRTFDSISDVSIPVHLPAFPPVADHVNAANHDNNADDIIEDDSSSDDDDDDDDYVGSEDDDHDVVTGDAGRDDWGSEDTGNTFASFEHGDDVMAWFDDRYYLARIVEVDDTNELFRLVFYDDNMEVNDYKAQWMKHVERE